MVKAKMRLEREIKGKLSFPIKFKMHNKILGRTKCGLSISSTSFGKPLDFNGVQEIYDFEFRGFNNKGKINYIVVFKKGPHVYESVLFDPFGPTTISTTHNSSSILKIELFPDQKGLFVKLGTYYKTYVPDKPYGVHDIPFAEWEGYIMNQLEWGLTLREIKKYKYNQEDKNVVCE